MGYDFYDASIRLSLFFCILTGYTFGGFFLPFLLLKTSQTRSYRNRVPDFDDHLMLNATGLWNLYLDAA